MIESQKVKISHQQFQTVIYRYLREKNEIIIIIQIVMLLCFPVVVFRKPVSASSHFKVWPKVRTNACGFFFYILNI